MSQGLRETLNIDSGVLRAVDRAMAELRRGGLLLLREGTGRSALVQAAETATEHSLALFDQLGEGPVLLILTRQRAASLALAGAAADMVDSGIVALSAAGMRAETIAELADPTTQRTGLPSKQGGAAWTRGEHTPRLASAAVALAKTARLLPALVYAPLAKDVDHGPLADRHDLLMVEAAAIEAYGHAAADSLSIVASARVPLAGAPDTRITAFRPADGGVEHLAIIIGEPSPDAPVLTRLHSECFTGDLLGSLRCDCGDQLRGAIETIAAEGSGVLLYLAQEGRGIGLVNKLRAYSLQDLGVDTYAANQQLGFDADERVYLPAAEMLRHLGFERIRLLTNNIDKMNGLTRYGISVEERVPHRFPGNGHNEFYLETKVTRGGHLI